MAVLEVLNMNFTYTGATAPSLSDISLDLKEGESLLLCGPVGCGKSTLISCLLPDGNPRGRREGELKFHGTSVGYVSQSSRVSVTDRVFSELAFPLENQGLPAQTVLRRVSELAAALGIEKLLQKRINNLSGGEQRLVALGAALITRPELLLLDEPASQLDPITAAGFYDSLFRIARDNGISMIISEHRTEEVISLCDRAMVLKNGRVAFSGKPCSLHAMADDPLLRGFLPVSARLAADSGEAEKLPLSVSEGKVFLRKKLKNTHPCVKNREIDVHPLGEEALVMRDVYYAHAKGEPNVLRGIDLSLRAGEGVCILGGNGSGKSTALTLAAGLRHPFAGKCRIFGKSIKDYRGNSLWDGCVALVPQNVRSLFVHESVKAELEGNDPYELIGIDLSHIYHLNPYDISGGEARLLGLALALAAKPRLLLLDEPTDGVDPENRARLGAVLRRLKASGVAILAVTHDPDLAPLFADRCALLSAGRIVADCATREFFAEGDYYATTAARMSRGIVDGAITESELSELIAEATHE